MALSKVFLRPVARAFSPSIPNDKMFLRPGLSDFSVLLNMEYFLTVFLS